MAKSPRITKPCKIAYVALGNMYVSPAAQRELRQYRVDHLLSNFDPERIGVLTVNRRESRHYIVDGQHRFAALKQWLGDGWKSQQVECSVYEGLSEDEEADLFLDINDTLQTSILDKFRISLTAGRGTELEIAAVVQSEGLNVSGVGGEGGIMCVGTLYRIYKRGGHEALRRSLAIARDAYGDPGFKAVVLDGLSLLAQRYNGKLDDARAIAALSKMRGGVNGLIGQAEVLRQKTGATKPVCIAASAVKAINRTKGPNLPSWWKE